MFNEIPHAHTQNTFFFLHLQTPWRFLFFLLMLQEILSQILLSDLRNP